MIAISNSTLKLARSFPNNGVVSVHCAAIVVWLFPTVKELMYTNESLYRVLDKATHKDLTYHNLYAEIQTFFLTIEQTLKTLWLTIKKNHYLCCSDPMVTIYFCAYVHIFNFSSDIVCFQLCYLHRCICMTASYPKLSAMLDYCCSEQRIGVCSTKADCCYISKGCS